MINKEPTQEQVRELWEWCGHYKECGYCSGSGRSYSSPDVYSQCQACEGWGYFAPRDLDLNNLFKYTVPQFAIKFGITKTRGLLRKWINDAYMSLPEAKDLCLAIYETLKQGEDL